MAEKLKLGIITDCIAGLNLTEKFISRQSDISVCKLNKGEFDEEYIEFTRANSTKQADFLFDIDALLISIKPPRVILLVCKDFSQDSLRSLMEKLDRGDTLIDCCDMSYKESALNAKMMARAGISYLGTGFVYATDDIIKRPSFMISGDRNVYNKIKGIFGDVSASVDRMSCAAYVGPDGAGQFVKMVNSAIYYSYLELISETVYLLRYTLGLQPDEICDVLADFNSGEASGFLVDTASDVIYRKDKKTGKYLIDIALDRVKYSVKDMWIGNAAFELGCPIPTILESVNMRFMSRCISERIASSQLVEAIAPAKISFSEQKAFIESCRRTLYVGMICGLAQGFSLLKRASDAYEWDMDILAVACTLQGGTFIQSDILFRIIEAYSAKSKPDNILLSDYFSGIVNEYCPDVRKIAALCVNQGYPLPAISSILQYIDCYRCRRLPTVSIQLIRDCIAENGFERLDGPGVFYGDWNSPDEIVSQKKTK